MAVEIPKGLKITFIASVIVAMVFGIIYTFFYGWYANLINWPFETDLVLGPSLGVTLWAIAAGCRRAAQQTEYQQVRVWMSFGIAWLLFSVILDVWAVIALSVMTVESIGHLVMSISIMVALLVLYIYYAAKLEREYRKS